MWQQPRLKLNFLEGSTIEIATEYSSISGILVEVKSNYIVLRTNTDLLYIPLTSIKSISY